MVNLKNWIISAIISLIVYAIVINHSNGRISRNDFIKIKLYMFLCCVVYWIIAIILYNNVNGLLVIIGMFAMPVFMFKWMQISIQRLHDIGYSGWYLLFDCIPIIDIYYIYLRYFKEGKIEFNEFDYSIDYLKFLRKNKLYPEINAITIYGKNFSINNVAFEYRKDNNQEKIQCSRFELEEEKTIMKYCKEKLEQVENAHGYGSEYKISFLYKEEMLQSIKEDLHAITIKKNYLNVFGKDAFIQRNGFIYDIVYDKNQIPDVLAKFGNNEINKNMVCNNITNAQLKELIKNIV
jgi:hypothetical protein